MVRAAGRKRRRRAIENPPDFLKAQQVPIEGERLLQIFHIEHDMAEIVRFHGFTSRT